eukprot:m.222812 g.222812  ORF g.222812 m.222812 type:complete len:768 (-) comp15939_c2_seq2:116-2419(-)
MGRIIVKGGVWKNSEDEILKAAVMKYGKNQWSRIASLLQRKTAKQCKVRWLEWLDPSIKKTEWSREEEEMLLHLAKLFPTQWRTIAPRIGRTASQCLEHYEKLLDQAQGGEAIDPENDPRRLRPGEIDPNPHTRPARPDQVDMDEDEKEMLSEARARLANTQGKKAKRKAREKSLEEARRLASLQKRRELRAAGIETFHQKRKRRGVDYGTEIPFEKKPAIGFFDPSKDGEHSARAFKPVSREEAEGGPRRDTIEEQKRKEDKKRQSELEKKDMPRAVMIMNKMSEEPQRKRSKLVLPAPQTTDSELEELVKMGMSAEQAMAQNSEKGAKLLQDYSMTPAQTLTTRTPQGKEEDPLMREAQNILAFNNTDSVLEGGENTPLHEGGGNFSGVTPERSVQSTPNTVLTTPYRAATGGSTPVRSAAELADTPLRDNLGINTEADSSLLTPRSLSEKRRQEALKNDLREGLASLPAPSSNFDVVVPDLPADVDDKDGTRMVEDAADSDARALEKMNEEEAKRFKRLSQVVQRGLPVPKHVNTDILRTTEPTSAEQVADEVVKREILDMIRHDKGMPTESRRLLFEDKELEAAKDVLEKEIAIVREKMGHMDVEEKRDEHWHEAQKEVMYLPKEKRFGRTSMAKNKDKIDSLEMQIKTIREGMTKQLKKITKIEKKSTKLTLGYMKRSENQISNISKMLQEIEENELQFATFSKLRDVELKAIPLRTEKLNREVEKQLQREVELQARYSELLAQRDAALAQKATTSAGATNA